MSRKPPHRCTPASARLVIALSILVTSSCGGSDPAGTVAPPPPPPTQRPCAPGNLVCHPLDPLPDTIAETGLAAAAPDFVRPSGAHGYTPAYELYADGLRKERFLLLPRGAKVDNANRTAWEYPLGALFVKTFFDDGAGGRRPVETRLIRRVDDRFDPFEYAVYQWSADGTSAQRIDISGNNRGRATVTVAGRSFMHTIPSRNDCGECHEKNALAASTIIGFDEVRLNHKLAGATATQLAALAALDVFTTAPPSLPAAIEDADPVTLGVKRFVFGNCAHCHNGKMNLVDLRPDVLASNTIDKAPDSPGVTPPPGVMRVVPGDPEKSLLFLQTRGSGLPIGLRQMPQVGVEVRDLPEFVSELENMKAWIRSLPK